MSSQTPVFYRVHCLPFDTGPFLQIVVLWEPSNVIVITLGRRLPGHQRTYLRLREVFWVFPFLVWAELPGADLVYQEVNS